MPTAFAFRAAQLFFSRSFGILSSTTSFPKRGFEGKPCESHAAAPEGGFEQPLGREGGFPGEVGGRLNERLWRGEEIYFWGFRFAFLCNALLNHGQTNRCATRVVAGRM